MISKKISRTLFFSLFFLGLTAFVHAADQKDIEYFYQVKIDMFSIQNGPQGLDKDSYYFEGSGSAGRGSIVGLDGGDSQSAFVAEIRPVEEKGRFIVTVDVKPRANSAGVKPLHQRLDMSDLKPVSIDLSMNEQEKRIHKLNLTPTIECIDHTKRPINPGSLKLNQLSLNDSRVIVDGWRYAGTISCSGMNLAVVDIPGYAKIEFATQPFRGAEPIGALQDGTLTIKKAGSQINSHVVVIDNVKLGSPAMTIPGGLYEVWVRWSRPSQTLAQAAQELANMDVEKNLAGINADEATKNKIRAAQKNFKENIGRLNDADFATDGLIYNLLTSSGIESGIGPFKPGDLIQ